MPYKDPEKQKAAQKAHYQNHRSVYKERQNKRRAIPGYRDKYKAKEREREREKRGQAKRKKPAPLITATQRLESELTKVIAEREQWRSACEDFRKADERLMDRIVKAREALRL